MAAWTWCHFAVPLALIASNARVTASAPSLAAFQASFATRAASVFADDVSFQARVNAIILAAAATPEAIQSIVVLLKPQYNASSALGASLEAETGATLSSPVGAAALAFVANYSIFVDLGARSEVEHAMIFLPELKVTPHFERLAEYALNVTGESASSGSIALSARIGRAAARGRGALARARGASAKSIAARVQAAHSRRCEAHGNAPARPPSCSGSASTPFTIGSASNETIVARGVPFSEALTVALEIADDPEILSVEPMVPMQPFNRAGGQLVTSGSRAGADGLPEPVGTNPIWEMGLHGEGEIVAVGDTGLDVGHCFFENALGETAAQQVVSPQHRKVLGMRSFSGDTQPSIGGSDHGTHVVGTIVGSPLDPSAAYSDYGGLAPAAKVMFTDLEVAATGAFLVPDDLLNDYFAPDHDAGARIFSNSWGTALNYYLQSSSDVDAFMYLYDDALVLFAAGNDGSWGGATVGAPATCKNCLAVGASQSHGHSNRDGNVASFSSQGPALPPTENASTFDPAITANRIKPEVVAPGHWIFSAASDTECDVTAMAGTSMATPLVAAAAALTRQYLREGRYPTGQAQSADAHEASGALLRALMIHSAVPLNGTYQGVPLQPPPTNVQGFGRVQLDRILFAEDAAAPPSSRMLFDDDASHAIGFFGDEYCLSVSTRSTDALLGDMLKVTLTWSDPPAWPFAREDLVNDLDLTLRSVGSDAPLSVDGLALHTDSVGTVEQATLRVPESGLQLRACVQGAAIRFRTQPFALVVTGPMLNAPPGPPASPSSPPSPPLSPPPPPLQTSAPPRDPPSDSGGGLQVGLVVGVIIGVAAVLAVAVVCAVCYLRKQQRAAPQAASAMSASKTLAAHVVHTP